MPITDTETQPQTVELTREQARDLAIEYQDCHPNSRSTWEPFIDAVSNYANGGRLTLTDQQQSDLRFLIEERTEDVRELAALWLDGAVVGSPPLDVVKELEIALRNLLVAIAECAMMGEPVPPSHDAVKASQKALKGMEEYNAANSN